MIDNVAVGLFARASGLALQLRLLVSGAVTGVFYPAFREVRDRGEPLAPPYLRVVAAYTGITWPAMAGIAVMAEPLVDMLYGSRWLAAAPLLAWVALSQLCYSALPLNGDLPILLGRKRELINRNIADAALSVALLALAAPFGLIWVAVSRFAHGLLWIALYASFMRGILNFSWSGLLRVWGKSLLVTLAAVGPILASYALWRGPAEAGFVQAIGGALAGVLCWLAALLLIRHPLFAEIAAMLGEVRAAYFARPTVNPNR